MCKTRLIGITLSKVGDSRYTFSQEPFVWEWLILFLIMDNVDSVWPVSYKLF